MTGEIARHQFQQINPDHSRHSSRNPLFQDNTSALKRFTFIVFKTNFLLRTVEIRISGFLQNLENPINTQPPNQEHQSPQEVWIWKEENGKQSKDVFFKTPFVHFLKVVKKKFKTQSLKGAHPCTSSSGQGGGKRVLEDFF